MSKTITHKDILKLLTGKDDWKLTGTFGEQKFPRQFKHDGVDYATPVGTPLMFPADGIVTFERFGINKGASVSFGEDFGNYTGFYIPEWDLTFLVAHTKYLASMVDVNKAYKKGFKISETGNTGLTTGPHLHLGVARGRHNTLSSLRKAAIDFTKVSIIIKDSIQEIAEQVIAGRWGSGDARKTALVKAGYDYAKVQAKVNEILGAKTPATSKNPEPVKPAPAPVKKSNAVIAKEVLAGKWGSGAARKTQLEKAGYNYVSIQNEVNKLLANPDVSKKGKTITVDARIEPIQMYGTRWLSQRYSPFTKASGVVTFKVVEDYGDVLGVQAVSHPFKGLPKGAVVYIHDNKKNIKVK